MDFGPGPKFWRLEKAMLHVDTGVTHRREVIIKPTHRGLWYEDGVLKRVLEPGRYKRRAT